MPQQNDPRSGDSLQFHRAEYERPAQDIKSCAACKSPIAETYYHVNGHVVCPLCAARIQQSPQAAPSPWLARGLIYGGGAAIAGCAIYAVVAIVTGFEAALVSILIGYMVGNSIRRASGGMGGRPQQILAVALTYFAITTSYIPVVIYHGQRLPAGQEILSLVVIAAVAPFFSLARNLSGILTIVIIFFGLSRAWKLTGTTKLQVTGPYEAAAGAA